MKEGVSGSERHSDVEDISLAPAMSLGWTGSLLGSTVHTASCAARKFSHSGSIPELLTKTSLPHFPPPCNLAVLPSFDSYFLPPFNSSPTSYFLPHFPPLIPPSLPTPFTSYFLPSVPPSLPTSFLSSIPPLIPTAFLPSIPPSIPTSFLP